jgi:hypothetical protein
LGNLDRVPKELESRTLSSQDSRRDGSGMDTNPQGKVGRIRTQLDFQLLDEKVHSRQNVTGKPGHFNGMSLASVGKS